MFEGSLVESRGLQGSSNTGWTALGSMTLQCAVAGLLIALPMMHPEKMLVRTEPPRLVIPTPVKPPPLLVQAARTSANTATHPPAAEVPRMEVVSRSAGTRLVDPLANPAADPPPGRGTCCMQMDSGQGDLLAQLGPGPGASGVSVVRARPASPLRVSSGVVSGMLLTALQPVYPPIAKAAGVQGTVVMEAVISKTGRIESLHVVTGPEMLRRAALDAVQAARYQPYKLNGEATEVQTTITVNFRLGS